MVAALLEIKAVERGQVVIRGVNTDQYLCMDTEGSIFGSVSPAFWLQETVWAPGFEHEDPTSPEACFPWDSEWKSQLVPVDLLKHRSSHSVHHPRVPTEQPISPIVHGHAHLSL